MRLAKKGQEIQRPIDAFKDPVVMEFLDLGIVPPRNGNDLGEAHAAIRQLMASPEKPSKKIGFQLREKRAAYGRR
jgi:hypothetical protein